MCKRVSLTPKSGRECALLLVRVFTILFSSIAVKSNLVVVDKNSLRLSLHMSYFDNKRNSLKTYLLKLILTLKRNDRLQ